MAAKLCFRFTVLTAERSGEAREAVWSGIDFDAREWRIPSVRMKNGTEHRVPLSKAALDVLEQARALKDESDLLFPSPLKKGRPLSNMTMTKLLRDAAIRATLRKIHDCSGRSYISTDHQDHSACGMVARRLRGMSYATVRSIWRRRPDRSDTHKYPIC